ncbi:MAG: hypothetical protein GXP53_02055 [Deltaproteobacteria bacterium]|nr:hypothetical protein [Deltaproteobacteria bacterium]
MTNPLPEKYDLEKILAEIEDDKEHEENRSSQNENISQPVITALKDKISKLKKGKNS